MTITPQNIVRHELIGLKVRVFKSADPSQKALIGKVVDESYNMIKIETKNGKEKNIPKGISIFIFTLPDRLRVKVDGKLLIGRPEDRIKKKLKRW